MKIQLNLVVLVAVLLSTTAESATWAFISRGSGFSDYVSMKSVEIDGPVISASFKQVKDGSTDYSVTTNKFDCLNATWIALGGYDYDRNGHQFGVIHPWERWQPVALGTAVEDAYTAMYKVWRSTQKIRARQSR